MFTAAQQSPPTNDICSSAIRITGLPYTSPTLTNVGASTNRSPVHNYAGVCLFPVFGDVWFTYTPDVDGYASVSTCGTNTDTYIHVLLGNCDWAECLSGNDEGCAPASKIDKQYFDSSFTYFILVSSYNGYPAGDFVLRVTPVSGTPPINDVCSNAITIDTLPFNSGSLSTDYSNREVLPSSNCNFDPQLLNTAGDVWFKYSPATVKRVDISLCSQANYDSYLYLLEGTCDGYTCLEATDDSCGQNSGPGRLPAVLLSGGTTYYIVVSGWYNKVGSYTLKVTELPSGPSNDLCSDAITINSLPFDSGVRSTAYATRELIVTSPCSVYPADNHAGDVWFRYTPPIQQIIDISLCNSATNFDSTLHIFQGSCGSHTCLASNDDDMVRCAGQSFISQQFVSPDNTYFIVVSGYKVSFGNFRLTINNIPANNDECAGAVRIDTLPFTFTGDTAPATSRFGCSSGTLTSPGPDVWFSFTPSTTLSHVYISTCSSHFDTFLFLVSGNCNSLECVESDNNSCFNQVGGSQISDITLQARTPYFIVVSGEDEDYGVYTLNIYVDSGATISITSPASNALIGATQSGNFRVSGSSGSSDVGASISVILRDSNSNSIQLTTTVRFDMTWSVSTSILNLNDGPISIAAAIRDTSGNEGSTFSSFTKDATVSVAISSPTQNQIVNIADSNDFTISGSGDAGATVIVTVSDSNANTANLISNPIIVSNTGSWSTNLRLDSQNDGNVRITASITDIAGNTATSSTITVVKDTIVSVSISSPTNLQFVVSVSREKSLAIRGFADVGSYVIVSVADQNPESSDVTTPRIPVSTVGSWATTIDVSSLSDGSLLVHAYAYDVNGNSMKSRVLNLVKDTAVSTTSISSPANGSSISKSQSSSLVISGVGEGNAKISLRITGTSGIISKMVSVPSNGSWTTTVNISSLPAGRIDIGGSVTDAAGNSGAVTAISITKLSS